MPREIVLGTHRVLVEPATQRLRLAIDDDAPVWRDPHDLQPTAPVSWHSPFVSASLLIQKAKQFDDGLHAAVEIAAQRGAGRFAGKRALLAAARLGGFDPPTAARLEPAIAAATDGFLADETISKPLGFYTWNADLERIFRQDRLLQRGIDRGDEQIVVGALAADQPAGATYRDHLTLVSKLTNAVVPRDESGRWRVFPPSQSHETALMKRLYGNSPLPDEFSAIDEMIRCIRAGQLPLAPTATSGWYDYQTWAHEALVVPEEMPEARTQLVYAENYRERLLDLFKGGQALARETHVKQLEVFAGARMPGRPLREPVRLVVSPGLTVEPLVTYYRRRAEGYRFVRAAIEDAFGAAAVRDMVRVGPSGARDRALDAELDDIEAIFRGADAVACREIGSDPDPSSSAAERDASAARFAQWAAQIGRDPDVGQDLRMMVPVAVDAERGLTKVWAFLGWTTAMARVSFDREPRAEIFDALGRAVSPGTDLELRFASDTHQIAYPVVAETYVTHLLDRETFRALCDRVKTRFAILAAIGGAPAGAA
jgi:hypothetical protein